MTTKRATSPLLMLLFLLLFPSLQARSRWSPDILGPRFQATTVRQRPDYYGPEVSTVIRRLADCPSRGLGVLYIHGFNDYFFQKEMADSFAAHAIDFYAVDLRGYGRSTLPGRRQFDIRNISEYYSDIDSALSIMQTAGIDSVILMGHSTGGLIAASFMARHPSPMVCSMILNSPFLDWNLGKTERWIWAVDLIGAIIPRMKIPQGMSDAYSAALLASEHGEWNFNTAWKHPVSPDVTAGWVRAIDLAQRWLHHHPYTVKVPVLLMYSAQSYFGDNWTPEASRADAVLDVNEIRRYGMSLSLDVHAVKVVGGLHDLVLSAPGVRAGVYKSMFRWIGVPPCTH